MTRHRLLSADEEVDLFMRIEAGRAAKAALADGRETAALRRLVESGADAETMLVECNMGLVHKAANKRIISDPALEYDDMVGAGLIGLVEAMHRYDWRRGNRFSTVAIFGITSAMSIQIHNSGRIRIPVYLRDSKEKRGRNRALLDWAAGVMELDAAMTGRKDGEGLELGEMVADGGQSVEEQVSEKLFLEQAIKRAKFPAKQLLVLMDWAKGYSSEAAGKRHGMSKALAHLARKRLRAAAAGVE